MSSKASHLYNNDRPRNLNKGREISSSTTLSFTSQLSSLINSSGSNASTKTSSARSRSKKEDIFTTHNKNSSKRAKRDLEPDNAGAFQQKHTTSGETLDNGVWERSRRKMEDKARLYAAMKRGDIEDIDERYAVDFDAKWAEAQEHEARVDEAESEYDDEEDEEQFSEQVEYTDEFGRTRKGTKLDALRARQQLQRKDDPIGARPNAPSNLIRRDAIQYEAFDPDAPRLAQMEELAKKRDTSLTPPPEEHFDANKEIRTKGTGFFQFSSDADERKRQMEALERERSETERRREERNSKLTERRAQIEARRREIQTRNAKRKAAEFLEGLGAQMKAEKRQIDSQSGDQETRENGPAVVDGSTPAPELIDRIEGAIEKD